MIVTDWSDPDAIVISDPLSERREATSHVPALFHFGRKLPDPLIALNIPDQFGIHELLIQRPESEFIYQFHASRRYAPEDTVVFPIDILHPVP